jgi:hypothetical protein
MNEKTASAEARLLKLTHCQFHELKILFDLIMEHRKVEESGSLHMGLLMLGDKMNEAIKEFEEAFEEL